MFQLGLSLSPEEMVDIVDSAPISEEIKEMLRIELPQLVERLNDSIEKAINPSKVWLESMQFADYVHQMGQHLVECGSADCTPEIGHALSIMSSSYKNMAEDALQMIDEMEKEDGSQA